MQSKSLLIAIAAFAVTTTGVAAYGGENILDKAGLSEEQKSALVQAHELKTSGKFEQARDVLIDAGINEDTLLAIHHARHQARTDMQVALEMDDYDAFIAAVDNTPLGEIVTTPADFEQFRAAHELRQDGEVEAAQAILEDMGIEKHAHDKQGGRLLELNDTQREAMQAARQANDKDAVRAIYAEAGVSFRH